MQSGVLRYPKRDKSFTMQASTLAACEGNFCAAAIVSVFERWHAIRLLLREHDTNIPHFIDLAGWLPFTKQQLQLELLGCFSKSEIDTALDVLEKKEFISTQVPASLAELPKEADTSLYLLRTDKLNAFYDAFEMPATFTPEMGQIEIKRKTGQIGKKEAVALKVFEYRDMRRKAFWEKRNRKVNKAKPDAKRIRLIADRNTHFTLEELCLAVEGNLLSDFHQGNNPQGTVYDSVELIFKDNSKVEFFISKARAEGKDEDFVQRMLSGAPDISSDSYIKFAKMLLPYVLGQDENISLAVRKTVVAYGKSVDLNPLKNVIVPLIEREAGMYAESHAERLRIFATALRNYAN